MHVQTTFSALEISVNFILNAFRSVRHQETCQLIPRILSPFTILNSFLNSEELCPWFVLIGDGQLTLSKLRRFTLIFTPALSPLSMLTGLFYSQESTEPFAFTFHDLVTLLGCDKSNNLLFIHLLNWSATRCTKCLVCSHNRVSIRTYMIFTMKYCCVWEAVPVLNSIAKDVVRRWA